MSVRQRILALKLFDRQNKHPDVVRDMGVTVKLNSKENKNRGKPHVETYKRRNPKNS